jgi:hypothetical protein
MEDSWKLRMYFGLARLDFMPVIEPDYDRLPGPLQPSARAMHDRGATQDERLAAGGEFLALSEEWSA